VLYFVVRYSRKRNPVPGDIADNLWLEIFWTVVPTLLVLLIFWMGWKGFQYMRTVPPDAMLVKVTGRMWSWSFEYENGKQSNVLNVPLQRPVRLAITSADVVHSLFIPAYRIKEDAVPGRETYLWFLPDELGSYDLFCTEYCGTDHSGMITKVVVMSPEDFEQWYGTGEKPAGSTPHVQEGDELIQEKGCLACHSLDGSAKIGPTFKGLFNRKVIVVTAGKERTITVDEEYIMRSIKDPAADMVKGFPPIMPAIPMTDEEMRALVDHIKTLK
jgi:cytochrome c oxidase subunit 2